MKRLIMIYLLLFVVTGIAYGSRNVDAKYYSSNADVVTATYTESDNFMVYDLLLDLDYQTLDVVYFYIDLDNDYESASITYHGSSSLDSSWVDISYAFNSSMSLSDACYYETIQDSSLYWYQATTRSAINLGSFLGPSRYLMFKFVGGSQIPSGGLKLYVTIELKIRR